MNAEDFLNSAGAPIAQSVASTSSSRIVRPADLSASSDAGPLNDSDLQSSPARLSYRQEIEMRKAKQREEKEANLTFKPSINKRPVRRDPPGTPKENRFDKLYSDALKRHISSHIKEESREKEKDYSFAPTLVSRPSSRSHSRSSSRNNSRQRMRVDQSAELDQSTLEAEFLDEPLNDSLPAEPTLLDRLSMTTIRKKEAQSPAAAREMTFSPAISKKAKAIETLGGKEVTQRLFEHSKTATELLEQRRTESVQKEMENCPFSPQLATRSRPNSAQRARSGAHAGLKSSNVNMSVTSSVQLSQSLATTQRLYRYEEEKNHKLEEARKVKEEKEMNGVTFQPQLVTKRPTTPSQIRVHDRLAAPIEKSVSPQVALAYAEYTFHPKLISKRTPSPNRYSADFASIHDRLFEQSKILEKEKLEHVECLRQSLEAECTFRPTINDVATSRDNGISPFERLLQPSKSPERMHRVESEMFRECTYTPVLSTRSYHIANQVKAATNTENVSVFARLAEEEELKKQEEERRQREKERQEEEKLKECSFQPVIPRRSSMLSSRSIDFNCDVHTRLSNAKTISRSMSICTGNNFIEPHGIINDNVSLFGGSNPDFDSRSVIGFSPSNGGKDEPQVKRIVKDEKELKSLFERLSAPTVRPEAGPQSKSIIVPKTDVEAIVERLANHRTKSVILRNEEDPEAAKMIKEFSLLKEVARIPSQDFENVVDRLRSHTIATAAAQDLRTLSRSASMDFGPGGSVYGGNISDTASVASSVISSSPSALQAALSNSRSVRRRSFAQNLENSYSPLSGIPRSMSRDDDGDHPSTFGMHSPVGLSSYSAIQVGDGSTGHSPNGGNRSPRGLSVNTQFRGLTVDTSTPVSPNTPGIAVSPGGYLNVGIHVDQENGSGKSSSSSGSPILAVPGKITPRLSRSLSNLRIFEEIREGDEEEEREESDVKKVSNPLTPVPVSPSVKNALLVESPVAVSPVTPAETSVSPQQQLVGIHSPRKGLTMHKDSFRHTHNRLSPTHSKSPNPSKNSTPVSIRGKAKSNPSITTSSPAPNSDPTNQVAENSQPVVSPRVVKEIALLPSLNASFIITKENGKEVLREAMPSPAPSPLSKHSDWVMPPAPPAAEVEAREPVPEAKSSSATDETPSQELVHESAVDRTPSPLPVEEKTGHHMDKDTEDFLNSIPQVSVDESD